MVDLVISAAQIKSAPHEVKEWIRATILDELALESEPGHGLENRTGAALAECSLEEASLVLEQIRDDYIACQVFFELGRDSLREQTVPPELHRIAIANILRHIRLGDPKHLGTCLNRIGEAFQAVRHDPNATLFALDRAGGLYVHDTTKASIEALWQALVTSRMLSTSELPGMTAPAGPTVPLAARPQSAAGWDRRSGEEQR